MSIENIFNTYFNPVKQGPTETFQFFKGDTTCGTKAKMAAIIASYFTIVIPMMIGAAYGISTLAGRCSKAEKTEAGEAPKTESVLQRLFGCCKKEEKETELKDNNHSSDSE